MRIHYAFLVLLAGIAQIFAANRTLIEASGTTWRDLHTATAAPANDAGGNSWLQLNYDDSAWLNGTGEIGYGDGDEGTVIASPVLGRTVYFRTKFDVADASIFKGLFLRLVADDGAVVYLNGTEIKRYNMAAGAVAFATLASTSPAATVENAFQNLSVALPVGLLVNGTNSVSVEVHQNTATSPDMSFDLELQGTTSVSATPPYIIRGPYLQNATPGSMTVRWRTNVATGVAGVRYGGGIGAMSNSATGTSTAVTGGVDHQVVITGLGPDSKQLYAITHGGEDIEGADNEHFFRTLPVAGTVRPYRFWILGDCGTGRDGTYNGNAEKVRNAYFNSPHLMRNDGIMMLGDNAYDNGLDTEYQRGVFETYRRQLRNIPLWSCLGNHEIGALAEASYGTAAYFTIFNLPTAGEAGGVASASERYYSYDVGNVHFVVLDSQTTANRAAGSAMLTWLTADLDDAVLNGKRWIVAYWHHPPYTAGSHNSDTEIAHIEMRQRANPILESHGVDLVLGGHSHIYERTRLINGFTGLFATYDPLVHLKQNVNGQDPTPYTKTVGGNKGTIYSTTGSSGRLDTSFTARPVFLTQQLFMGSGILDVSGDRLDYRFLDSSGVIRDYFTIIKTNP